MEISTKTFLKLPEVPGVYTFWKKKLLSSEPDVPLYIGKAVNLKSRLNSYLALNLGVKTSQMMSEANSVTHIQVTSDLEALLLESSLIKRCKPKYNIVLKDDKHALYIVITKEKFPRVITCRKLYAVSYKQVYGPFPNSTNVKTIMKHVRKIFPYSDHKLGKKPCFYSHIGLCNPCPNTELNNIKYMQNIRNIKLVLSRKFNLVRNNLEIEMKSLSKLEKYEEAKKAREKIKALDYITQQKIDTQKFLVNPNLVEDIRSLEIENLKALLNKNCKLKIKNLHRIECFDVSHLAGVSATASMVVAIDGNMENSQYRHFKIKQSKGNSDYDSMREIAKRRITNLDKWAKPDLIIVDGGLGQVKAFDEIYKIYNIPVVGIAKHPDRLVFVDGKKIRLQGLTLQLVSRIRDEAHRFARRYHHLLVSKNLLH